jgi:molybdate transport system substrate-binding protein
MSEGGELVHFHDWRAARDRKAATRRPTIAAAADLHYALKEVADRFTKETGKEVKLSFGSSGNFTTQIRQGAPSCGEPRTRSPSE